MDEKIKLILNHPISTAIVIGTFANAIANIISAARGTGVKPIIDLKLTKPETK